MAEGPFSELMQTSIAQLQDAMAEGRLTSRALVQMYTERIAALDREGPRLNAVLELNPDAAAIAAERDDERRRGSLRGPLHGIPILLKDNVDTADRMQTTAGSLALVGAPPAQDATVAAALRAAGAVLLGKTNLSEWANIRSRYSSSGWCARNGQARNPHVLDRNPSGSSSGSGVAAAAALCAAAIGTETDGSIVSPANANGVVGIKPSVGRVSRAGIVPISHSQDTAGVHARSVADAAAVLTAIAVHEADPRDGATGEAVGRAADYLMALDPAGLRGARLGVVRNLGFGNSVKVDAVIEEAIRAMREAGADLIDVEFPGDVGAGWKHELEVMLFELKADLAAYLATRRDVALTREGFPPTLAGVIAFNEAHREEELRHFGQDHFVAAEERGPLTDPVYLEALAASQRSGQEGIDGLLTEHGLDALIAPTGNPAAPIDHVNGDRPGFGTSSPAARAGYPIVSVPAGFVAALPINLSFIGRRWSEETLIRLAYAFEQATHAWQPPRCLPTLPFD